MPSKDRVLQMIQRVEAGDFLNAFEEFYADDVVMQENAGAPTRGKDANREREKGFVGSIREIHLNRADSFVVDGDRVAINWKAFYTFQDGSRATFDQVALQTWDGDRIVREQFFYDTASLAG